ncbi:MAG: DNA (cytosine-5-)-methyltransferase [Deltaproteobacteria bacterium]|jgi:DNA (cytosine-5)-methyltransferase 1|nr:DNA (cytosine-5-)-methyltransferase [Deltaproteobacteria bacterium]
MRAIEICAGAGGQAFGLEQAGFDHMALVEIDGAACSTLRENRPNWNVIEGDVKSFSAAKYSGVDLLAGGVPCPPFSVAGKQLGNHDERDLFPEAIRLAEECNPKAIMLENVRGIFDPKFNNYRHLVKSRLESLNYFCTWELVNARDFGVSQHRVRSVLIALKSRYADYFKWPASIVAPLQSVGQLLYTEMASGGWKGADDWSKHAFGLAPTIVGGSKKHGGADLGPTRARLAWQKLGVDGAGIADAPPNFGFSGKPKLTVKMAALIQGFPSEWKFVGRKTPAYRQVGNAFPPPVAKALGIAIFNALTGLNNAQINFTRGRIKI